MFVGLFYLLLPSSVHRPLQSQFMNFGVSIRGNRNCRGLVSFFSLAIKANRLEWAGNFLSTYKPFLSEKDKIVVYPYCLANWYYERQELEV